MSRTSRGACVAAFLCFGATLLLATIPSTATAAEGDDNCIPIGVPAGIVGPGTYCLTASYAASGNTAVSIGSSNVVLDCNGHSIDGRAGGAGMIHDGVYAPVSISNVVVRNCRIRGFRIGIHLAGGSGHVVEDNRLDDNVWIGAYVGGSGSIARRNRIHATGGWTTVPHGEGLHLQDGADAIDNTIDGVTGNGATGYAYGIRGVYDAEGGSIVGNRVRGVAKSGFGQDFGIYLDATVAGQGKVVVRDNNVVAVNPTNSFGLFCTNGIGGRARDNTFSGWQYPIYTCATASGNVVRP